MPVRLENYFSWVYQLFTFLNRKDRSGQGEVFHNLMDYYREDRERTALIILPEARGIHARIARYKTTRTTIQPVRFKGWKGGR